MYLNKKKSYDFTCNFYIYKSINVKLILQDHSEKYHTL